MVPFMILIYLLSWAFLILLVTTSVIRQMLNINRQRLLPTVEHLKTIGQASSGPGISRQAGSEAERQAYQWLLNICRERELKPTKTGL